MRTSLNTIIVIATVIAHALSTQAQQLRIATMCAGAATLNNGSIITIGQPFVGVMSAGAGGVTLSAGIIPGLAPTTSTSALPVPPMLSGGAWQPGGVLAFQFLTQAGHNYVVEASTNLSTWTPIWTNLGDGSSLLFRDSNAFLYPRRFYRVDEW
jgi:hypothetical protein